MDLVSILPLVLLAVVFYLLIMRPARNRQKQQQQLIASVGPGTRIMTTAGFYGTISSREGDDVTVVLAPGVEVRMTAAAVAKVIQDVDQPTPGEPTSGGLGGPSAGE